MNYLVIKKQDILQKNMVLSYLQLLVACHFACEHHLQFRKTQMQLALPLLALPLSSITSKIDWIRLPVICR